ncbi:MAG TPA: hypothetical protein VG965_02730 [Patescibacteria group bacterium]|nr:hypothetical protein [Patescibacteria group bacterium]
MANEERMLDFASGKIPQEYAQRVWVKPSSGPNIGRDYEKGTEVIWASRCRLVDRFIVDVFSQNDILTPEQGGEIILDRFDVWKSGMKDYMYREDTEPFPEIDFATINDLSLDHVAVRSERAYKTFRDLLEKGDSTESYDHSELEEQHDNWKLVYESARFAQQVREPNAQMHEDIASYLKGDYKTQEEAGEERKEGEPFKISEIKRALLSTFVSIHIKREFLTGITPEVLLEKFPEFTKEKTDFAERYGAYDIYAAAQTLNLGDLENYAGKNVKYLQDKTPGETREIGLYKKLRESAIIAIHKSNWDVDIDDLEVDID